MSRLRSLRAQHHNAMIASLTARIAHITARMDHLAPGSPEWERLNAQRVAAWWKRNNQYAKLAKTTKES